MKNYSIENQKAQCELIKKWFTEHPETQHLSDRAVAQKCRDEWMKYPGRSDPATLDKGREYEYLTTADIRFYRQQQAAMVEETKKIQEWNSLAQGRKA